MVRYYLFPLWGFFLYLIFGMPRTYKSHVGLRGDLIKYVLLLSILLQNFGSPERRHSAVEHKYCL
jgi:hypothetical protein